jgi:hypothetical protein
MAIRPADLQSALIVSTQTQPIGQRAEQAPVAAQNAAQAQFIAKAEERNERVAATTDAKGNRIEARDQPQDQRGGGQGRKRERKPGDPFGEVVDEAAGLSDGIAHLIDYSA